MESCSFHCRLFSAPEPAGLQVPGHQQVGDGRAVVFQYVTRIIRESLRPGLFPYPSGERTKEEVIIPRTQIFYRQRGCPVPFEVQIPWPRDQARAACPSIAVSATFGDDVIMKPHCLLSERFSLLLSPCSGHPYEGSILQFFLSSSGHVRHNFHLPGFPQPFSSLILHSLICSTWGGDKMLEFAMEYSFTERGNQ